MKICSKIAILLFYNHLPMCLINDACFVFCIFILDLSVLNILHNPIYKSFMCLVNHFYSPETKYKYYINISHNMINFNQSHTYL